VTTRPALVLIEGNPLIGAPAAPEALAVARDLARQRARSMMNALLNDSANRE